MRKKCRLQKGERVRIAQRNKKKLSFDFFRCLFPQVSAVERHTLNNFMRAKRPKTTVKKNMKLRCHTFKATVANVADDVAVAIECIQLKIANDSM